MARFWVGNGGNWGDGSHWSSTSGGVGADLLGLELVSDQTMDDTSFRVTVGTSVYDDTLDKISGNYSWRGEKLSQSYVLMLRKLSECQQGKYYKVLFWAKKYGTGTLDLSIGWENGQYVSGQKTIKTGNVSGDWEQYISYFLHDISGGHTYTSIRLFITGADATTKGFLDGELSIQEILTYPTQADDVIFDANSFTSNSQVVAVDVVANCLSLDFTGIDQTVTLSSYLNSINIYGSLTLATNLTWTFTGTAYVYSKGSGTYISNGNTTSLFNRWYIDGIGITVTIGDNFSIASGNINHANGTLDINSKIFTTGGLYDIVNGTKSLTLGSGTLKAARFRNGAPTNFTFNYNTGTIHIRSTSVNDELNGATTFYNLTLESTNGICIISLGSNQVVNNVLTFVGYNSTTARLLVCSGTLGTQRTFTVPSANVVASNVDFRDVNFTNAINLSAIAGGSGDCGGNSNITFTTAVPQFFKHTSGAVNWSDSTKWFTATNGGGSAGRVPLPQDDVWFDVNSFAGASTLTVNCPRIGRSLDMSGVGQAVTMTLANSIETYGNHILGNNITPNDGANVRTLMGRGSFNLNTYNKPCRSIAIYAVGGVYTNKSDITLSYSFPVAYGTIDFNDYNLTCMFLSANSVGTSPTIYMGNGLFSLSGLVGNGSIWYMQYGTFYCEGSTIKLTTASGSDNMRFESSNKIYNKIWLSGTHTGNYDISTSNTIAELIIDSGRKVRFVNGTTQTIAKVTAKGTNTNKITIGSTTAAVATINYTGTIQPDIKFCDISYITATTPFKVRASINSGNNTNITFNDARFWVGGTGNIKEPLHWASTSGGVGTEILGSELISGGDFESGLIGAKGDGTIAVSTWTLNTISPISGTQDGRLVITTPYINRPYLTSWISTSTIDKWYKVSFDYKVNSGTANINSMHDGGTGVLSINQSLTGTGTFVYYIKCGGNSNLLGTLYFGNFICDVQIDNISIVEVTNMPSPNTDVFFDENSLGSDGRIVTLNSGFDCLSLDFENLTNTMTLSNSAFNLNVYGSLILSATKLTTTFTSTGYLYLLSTITGNVIISNGSNISWNLIIIFGLGGSWINQDEWNMGSSSVTHAKGTWTTNNKNITTTGLYRLSNASDAKTLNLGSSIFSFGQAWFQDYIILVLNAGTSTIKTAVTGQGGTAGFIGQGYTFYNVECFAFFVKGSTTTFNDLIIKGGTAPSTGALGTNIIVNGTLSLIGNDSTTRLLFASTTNGTQFTVTAENILFSNVNLKDINLQGNCVKDLSAIAGGARDLGNNSNIRFSPGLKKRGRQLGYNIGSPKQSTNGVQIGDQIWTAKNYNESKIGSLVIPEIQESNNVEQITNHTFDTSTDWVEVISSGKITITGGTANFNIVASYLRGALPPQKTNRIYKLTYTITATNGGILFSPSLANMSMPTTLGVQTAYGKFTWYENSLLIYSSTFIGSIDNIYLELIGWTQLDTIPNASDRVAWCNYNNLQANGDVYGKLYNWYAVNEINNQLIAINSDWRVPIQAQFITLSTYLGGDSISGGKMKALGFSHWTSPNLKADNSSGFNALGAGRRDDGGSFSIPLGTGALFSSITLSSIFYTPYYLLNTTSQFLLSTQPKNYANSLRLIKK